MTEKIKNEIQSITFNPQEFKYKWSLFNDTVIGGSSTCMTNYHDNIITFKGSVSPINNIGFCSLRANKIEHNLLNAKEVILRVKSDGTPFTFQMEYNEGWQNEKLSYLIHNESNNWENIRIPIEDFKKVKHCKVVSSKYNPKVLKNIYRFCIQVSSATRTDFLIEVESIRFIYEQ